MTKQAELALLDRMLAESPDESYIAGMLHHLRPQIEADIRSDFIPMPEVKVLEKEVEDVRRSKLALKVEVDELDRKRLSLNIEIERLRRDINQEKVTARESIQSLLRLAASSVGC